MLVLDTETATTETISKPNIMPGFDPERWPPEAQALLFGRAHLYEHREDGQWKKVYEWLFYPDDLPEQAIKKMERRFRCMAYRMGDWREPRDEPGVKCYLIPLSKWLEIFYWEAVAKRCLIVGFNLPFDLTRITCHVGPAKTRWFAGGFSVVIWPDPTGKRKGSLFRPKIHIRKLGQGMNTIEFARYKLGPNKEHRSIKPESEFLDLSQLVRALTGDSHSLDSACRAFGLESSKHTTQEHGVIILKYLLYNRQDVEITFQLAIAALQEFDRHPISRRYNPPGHLSEAKVFSSASIAKAYLKLMNIAPRLKAQTDFPRRVLGKAMEAYYGGRVEAKWRLIASPVVYLDFFSMYPTINVLMDLWKFVIAEEIEVVEDTEEARLFLERATLDDAFDPSLWSTELNRLVLVEPDGDIFPIRTKYHTLSEGWKIGLNQYYSDEAQWYPIADVLGSKLLNRVVPKILKSIRLEPKGIQKDLNRIDFRGLVSVDPAEKDFFKVMVEERAKVKAKKEPYHNLSDEERYALSLALKITANAGSYGILAQVNRNQLPTRKTDIQELWFGRNEPIEYETGRPEVPGECSFPPLAAFITAGARLMLALLERSIIDRGGAYAFCDTDSLAVISNQAGGLIEVAASGSDRNPYLQQAHALSWNDAKVLASCFGSLNPYDRFRVPGSILELKEENYKGGDRSAEQIQLYAFCIAPKRYCLFTEDTNRREIVSRMESALGALRPPHDGDWITEWWEAILRNENVPFADLPLVRQFTISNWDIYRRFKRLNRGKPYQAQIKPFNFFLATSANALMYQGRIRTLIAQYDPDSKKWENLVWLDYKSGQAHKITTRLDIAMARENERIGVETFGSYFNRYRQHPCREFLGPDGMPCKETTEGLLTRRTIRRLSTSLIGKETSVLALVEAGLEPAEVLQVPLVEEHWFSLMRPVLRDIKSSEVAKRVGVSIRTVQMWKAGTRRPSSRYKFQLEAICVEHARKKFQELGLVLPNHSLNIFLEYQRILD